MSEVAESQVVEAPPEGQVDTVTEEQGAEAQTASAPEGGEEKGYFSGKPKEAEGETAQEEAKALDLSFLPEDVREDFKGYASMDDLLADLKQGKEARADIPADGDYKVFVPEGLTEDENLSTAFKGIAKEVGLTQKQVDKLVDFNNARVLQGLEAAKAMEAKGREFLQKQWGDNYEANVALADKGIEAFGTQALVDILEQSGLKGHPAITHHFASLGKAISEASLLLPENKPKEILRTAGGQPMFRRQESE
jgi:hypothetical protein